MNIATPITVVILTYNEVQNLGSCLDSLGDVTDDIHVVDSGSTDGTVELAKERGVPVHFHRFEGFGSQRNWSIDHVSHKYPWVFHLDADEQFTPELVSEIRGRISGHPAEAGFFVPHRLLLGGRWLKHAGGYPTYQVRLFHRERLRFADHGHGQREVPNGPLGYLEEPYLHHAFAKGLDDWFAKHARYARLEAQQYMGVCSNDHRHPECMMDPRSASGGIFRQLLGRDAIVRRRALKRLSYRLPMRSLLRMVHILIVQRGLLDGRAGLTYARMLAIYEAMITTHLGMMRAGMFLESTRSEKSDPSCEPPDC